MNEQQAIDFLYDIKTDVVYQITTEEKEAIDEAMKALEKQLPKKLLVEKVERTKIYYCPNCTEKLMQIGFAYIDRQVLIPGRPPHCYRCGQRLDWSEE